MIKRNEGYTLPFVLVVMVVLCTVAISITSVTLRNLVNQQKFMDRMTDRYAAQGQIEMIVAQLDTVTDKASLAELCNGIATVVVTEAKEKEGENEGYIAIQLTATCESSVVVSEIKLTGTVASNETDLIGDPLPVTVDNFTLTGPITWEYTSYNVQVQEVAQ